MDKEIEVTNSNGDWSDDFQKERQESKSNWFKDEVPEGELSFTTDISFVDEGEKKVNNFNDQVVRFNILVNEEPKTLDIKYTQFDLLKVIASAKPIAGKKARWQRTGSTRTDTRRNIKFY